jgi:hypothetical protein
MRLTRRLLLILACAVLAPAATGDEPEIRPPDDEVTQSEDDQPPPREPTAQPQPGATESSDRFVPTERLRYDQEVDYPTDI